MALSKDTRQGERGSDVGLIAPGVPQPRPFLDQELKQGGDHQSGWELAVSSQRPLCSPPGNTCPRWSQGTAGGSQQRAPGSACDAGRGTKAPPRTFSPPQAGPRSPDSGPVSKRKDTYPSGLWRERGGGPGPGGSTVTTTDASSRSLEGETGTSHISR